MSKKLVIVESPAKARTLTKILGRGYSLMASLGHVRDLPKSQLGVDIENGFAPRYVVPRSKTKLVNELKAAARGASAVYLATDPDREGEAIAWHLEEVTRTDSIPYRRVTFHEITEEAVKGAFLNPRSIDMQLVNAQQARRVLDRLVGYKLSPLLWKKVRKGLSAGRVQSVAVRIIVDREREIQQFTPQEYWSIEAELARSGEKPSFKAALIGYFSGGKIEIHNEAQAAGLKSGLEQAGYSVGKVTTKPASRQPAPPFITSTLQQEAWRKLHFTAKRTMALAQQLYEGLPVGPEGNVGLITYMRTDSTRVAQSSIAEARDYIESKYGPEYLPARPRAFAAKAKGAQEAHEAVRPTRIHREPASIKQYLDASQLKLYELIWKRMVASQMAAARFENTTVEVKAEATEKSYLLRTSSSINVFPGFIALYTEGRDEPGGEDGGAALPKLAKGDSLKLLGLAADQHFTQPPPRYTEATLVKALEQWGIGRPSTYAPILSTIQEREYVTKEKGSLKPTELGIVVNDLLAKYFSGVVDVQFTARMENELDSIASDNRDWVNVVKEFYTPLEKDLEKASSQMERVKIADQITDETCPKCGKPIAIKVGRFGKFMACTGYPECRFTKPFQLKTGAACPQCGAELVQRMSKKKRVFYGCSRYPECTFASFTRPLPRKCPQCGGLLTQYRGDLAKCTKCDFKGKLPPE